MVSTLRPFGPIGVMTYAHFAIERPIVMYQGNSREHSIRLINNFDISSFDLRI
jgi:hypothetical protein